MNIRFHLGLEALLFFFICTGVELIPNQTLWRLIC